MTATTAVRKKDGTLELLNYLKEVILSELNKFPRTVDKQSSGLRMNEDFSRSEYTHNLSGFFG